MSNKVRPCERPKSIRKMENFLSRIVAGKCGVKNLILWRRAIERVGEFESQASVGIEKRVACEDRGGRSRHGILLRSTKCFVDLLVRRHGSNPKDPPWLSQQVECAHVSYAANVHLQFLTDLP